MRVVWPARALMLWWYVLSGAPHDKRLLVVVCEDDNELVAGMTTTRGTAGIRTKHNGTSNRGIKVEHRRRVDPQE